MLAQFVSLFLSLCGLFVLHRACRNSNLFMSNPFLQSSCHVFQDPKTRELTVAIGDGRTMPYRQFISLAIFELAGPYFVSPTSNITAMDPKKLGGLIGALMARQSRAPGTVIDVLVNEFLITDPAEAAELGVKLGSLREQKLDELIERILIQYGDDSVQELETASVLFNSVSNLAAKMIEDRRLGAFIEQSSRYVLYTQKDPITDSWYYYRPEAILNSSLKDQYIGTLDDCFALYAELADKLQEYYETLKPISEVEYAIKPNDPKKYRLEELNDKKEQAQFKRTYTFDIRTRACDTARVMLPAATLTALGMVANGRTFEHLLKRLYSSNYAEFKDIGVKLHDTLNRVIPKYVKRADPKGVEFWKVNEDTIRADIAQYLPLAVQAVGVVNESRLHEVPGLMSAPEASLSHMLAAAYYVYTRTDYASLVAQIEQLPIELRQQLMARAVGVRETRRDRVVRGFEHGYDITAEIVADFGVFRDLHRHRMCTLLWQRPMPHLGFELPSDIEKIGYGDKCRALAQRVAHLYDLIATQVDGFTAEYVVLFGHKIRFVMGMNLREAQHLLELRTVPQGHPNYRRVCQDLHKQLVARAPWLAGTDFFKFVDHNQYDWARADAEARQSQKLMEKGL